MKQQKGWRMSCDVGEVPTMQVKQQKDYKMSCDVGKAVEGLENEPHSPTLTLLHLHHSSFSNRSISSTTSQLILQPSVASLTSQALHLRHSSFSNPSAASSTPQLILQPFCCFTYITGTSHTSPGEPPMHRGMRKTVCGGLACYSNLLSLEVAIVLDSC